jgi:hypothetical protein
MSTKTSLLKRISQAAVIALLGSVASLVAAPASNAATNTSISGSCVARATVGGVIKVNVNGDNTQLIYAVQSAVTSASESSTTTLTPNTTLLSATPETNSTSTGLILGGDTIGSQFNTISYLVWLNDLRNGDNATNAGPGAASGIYAADPFVTVVCEVAKVPASFTLSSASASVSSSESATFTITPKDAAGRTTLLTGSESITVTSSLTTAKIAAGVERTDVDTGLRVGTYLAGGNVPGMYQLAITRAVNGVATTASTQATGSATARAVVTLGRQMADGISSGVSVQPGHGGAQAASDTITATGAFTVNVTNTAAATSTFTVGGTGSVGMVSATTASFTLTTIGYVYGVGYGSGSVAASGVAGAAVTAGYGIIDGNQLAPANAPDKTGSVTTAAALGGTVATATDGWTVSTANKDVTITWQLSGAGTMPITVAAVSTTSSTPAGITLGAAQVQTTSDTVTSMTFSATAPTDGQSYKITWNSSANTPVTLTITYADPKVNSANGNVVVTPASGKALTSGTVVTTAVVRDQFRNLSSGANVLWTVTGRNATASAVSGTTNASGVATYSFVDDATPATTLTDTVAVTATTTGAGSYNAGSSATFTWTASLTVTTLAARNNSTATDGDAVDTAITVTATALGASGEALSGYPVVFTGDASTYADSTSNTVTAYTSTAGVATATFYGKKIGTATITVTSGGKTATSTMIVAAGTARTIDVNAAAASMAAGQSKRVTATVKDRYGNAIEDATVTVSFTGTAGRISSVNGVAQSSATTDASGQVVVEVASDAATGTGTGTLTVKFSGGNTTTAALNGDGSATPARVTSATTAVTITAADSSVADAANAATDAAAEAIDAANAATDAANLAAEAADAATVAAEEARDAADAATAAVEELATQVATLMAALKAQITTLANTVAKIAKKVKA